MQFFWNFSLVSSCILLFSFSADLRVISYSGSLSLHILLVYFLVLLQCLLLLQPFPQTKVPGNWLIPFSYKWCFAYLSVTFKYSPKSSLWGVTASWQHAVVQASSQPLLLFKAKCFSAALCCSLQRSFFSVLAIPANQVFTPIHCHYTASS